MLPYEMIDLAQSTFSNSTAVYAVFLSLVSGYLVVGYLVGMELTKTQVTILTVLFLYATFILIWAQSAYVFWGGYYSELARGDRAEVVMFSPKMWMPAVIAVGNLLTVAACLFFMWNVRKGKKTIQ